MVDDDYVAGQVIGFFEVLGGQEHAGALGNQVPDGGPQLDPAVRVETGGGLVEQKQPWLPDEAGAEIQAAAHPARVGAHEPVPGVRESQPFEDLVGGAAGFVPAQSEQPGEHAEVLGAGHGRLDRGVLAGQPDDPPNPSGFHADIDTRDVDTAIVRPQEGRDSIDEGHLAGSVWPQQRCHLPGFSD